MAKIVNSKSGKSIELVPDLGWSVKSTHLWVMFSVLLVVIGLMTYLIFKERPKEVIVQSPVPVLEFRNADFESTSLLEDADASSFTLLDWQDHFSTSRAKVVNLASYLNDGRKAQSGFNVAALQNGSYLTQRLKLSDGSDFLAQPGLIVRVSGYVMFKDPTKGAPLRFALRVVQSVHPEMLQYEPAMANLNVTSNDWQPFSVDLPLTSNLKNARASEGQNKLKPITEVDLSGRELSLSIDNRSGRVIYLDNLSVEVLEK